MPASLVYFTF